MHVCAQNYVEDKVHAMAV